MFIYIISCFLIWSKTTIGISPYLHARLDSEFFQLEESQLTGLLRSTKQLEPRAARFLTEA